MVNRPLVFISYCHKDPLGAHLGVLAKQGYLRTCHDRLNEGCDDWCSEIEVLKISKICINIIKIYLPVVQIK